MAKIKVTAGAGRSTPIDPDIATGPGAQPLVLVAPKEIEVEETDHRIVRQLRSGDLVRVNTPATSSAPKGA